MHAKNAADTKEPIYCVLRSKLHSSERVLKNENKTKALTHRYTSSHSTAYLIELFKTNLHY